MFLFYATAEILIITMINFNVNCLPSARTIRGYYGPEPKSLEDYDSPLHDNDTTEYTDKPINTTEISNIKRKKKWQVGRFSRKQYEIVNMVWRKTKIFLDTEATTTCSTIRQSSTITPTTSYNNFKPYLTKRPIEQNSDIFQRNKQTESYIEFYYLDEIDTPKIDKKNNSSILNVEFLRNGPQISIRNSKKIKSVKTNSPFLAFIVNSPASTTTPYGSSSSFRDIKRLTFPFLYNNYQKRTSWDKLNNEFKHSTSIKRRRSKKTVNLEDYIGETCPLTTQATTESETITNIPNISTETDSNELSTTLYDKIKFFEIYDRQTENVLNLFLDTNQNKQSPYYNNNSLRDEDIVEQILLEHVDVNSSNHDGFHKYKAKKHINKNEYKTREEEKKEDKASIEFSPPSGDDYFERIKLNTSTYTSYKKQSESTETTTYVEISKVASWSHYRFAAVYVYEPSQILCDAAAVSQHWFITAGSCLSRQHRSEPSMEGRTAFVTYCGASWRQPERIAYVKYTLVHPKFNPHERSRRFLYNIGVIQVVVNMMHACPGWAPITLMGHQFITHEEGDMAAAIGWGLDRYASKYPETETPTHSLMAYHGLLHSNHCPGNNGYNEAKLVEPLHVIKNLYCLSLPPYNNEESDPVHGSLLMIGGKLLALYLQEERRAWGKQSAQYTGVWRLIPWIQEVAREPEDIDTFPADI